MDEPDDPVVCHDPEMAELCAGVLRCQGLEATITPAEGTWTVQLTPESLARLRGKA